MYSLGAIVRLITAAVQWYIDRNARGNNHINSLQIGICW